MPPTRATAGNIRRPVAALPQAPQPAAIVSPLHGGEQRVQPSVHARLREATSELHRALEQRLALLDPDLELHRYNAVLHAMYGYYVALEPALAGLAACAQEPPFPLRARTPRLERDLVSLGSHPARVQRLPCDMLPTLGRTEHLAGCLYVIEGAALGGRVITRVLHQRFGLSSETGSAFFAGDGHGVGARWQRVLAWLGGLPAVGCDVDAIVLGARETFATLTRWLELRGALK